MNNQVARLLVDAMASSARVEGMKAENQHRISNGDSIAYGEEAFAIQAGHMDRIAYEMAQASSFRD